MSGGTHSTRAGEAFSRRAVGFSLYVLDFRTYCLYYMFWIFKTLGVHYSSFDNSMRENEALLLSLNFFCIRPH